MSLVTSTTAEQLSEAFADFEDASRELSGFYRDLEQRVGLLTRELADSRSVRAAEGAEKKRLASWLDNLLEALPGGIVIVDQRGAVQEFNPVAANLVGPLVVGEAWSAVVKRAFAPRWDDGHDVSLADGRVVSIATQALSGEPGQIVLLTEVTETRRLQDQLAHHKRLSAKTKMAAAMAHQIRTPLSAALLRLGNVRNARDDRGRQRGVDCAIDSLRNLERLVNDMLLFARGGKLDVSPLSSTALFKALEKATADAFCFDHFAVEFVSAAGAGTVYVNLEALTSAALNLIENSQQACHGRGHMQLRCACESDMLVLHFVDDGPGIPFEQRALIFEPFHSTRSNGSGLGLPVAAAVAQAHGGDLELCESACGADFVMRLPLINATAPNSSMAIACPTSNLNAE